MLTNSEYEKPESSYKLLSRISNIRFMGNGLVTNLNYNNWRARRNGINPAFHHNTIAGYIDAFNDAADRLLLKLERHADTGHLVSILKLLHETTLDTARLFLLLSSKWFLPVFLRFI